MAPNHSVTHDPALRQYLKDLARIPTMRPGEELELGERIRRGDTEAFTRLVEGNLRFVVSYAKKYRGLGLPFQDLINAGNVGLIEAAKRFDPDKAVKFITYGSWWVKQAILQALAEQNAIFHMPQKQATLQLKMARAGAELQTALERPATARELAREMRISEREVDDLQQHRGEEVAIDSLLDAEHDFHVGDKMEQHLVPAADEQVLEESFRHSVRDLLKELDEKERRVVALRFGLGTDEPQTLKDIGDALGLSRERIRQIENHALNKLRRSMRARKLLGHLN
jgi:RNA polymerase primary sigma factor